MEELAAAVVAAAVAALGGLLVSAVQAIITAPFRIVGAVVRGVVNLFAALGRGMLNLISMLPSLVVAFVRLAVGGLVTFARALQTSVQSMLDFARSAQILRSTTGQSMTGAAGTLLGYKALGIQPQSVQGALGGIDPFMLSLRARLFGVGSPLDANNMPDIAAAFQRMMSRGLVGRLFANQMAGQLGMDSPDFRAVLMTNPALLRDQQVYGRRAYSQAGLTPGVLQRYAEQIPMLINRIGIQMEVLRMKLATAFLPIIEAVLRALTSTNSIGTVGEWIESAVEWLFVRAPKLATSAALTVVHDTQNVVGRAIAFLTPLIISVPMAIYNASQRIAAIFGLLGQAMGAIAPGIASMIAGIVLQVSMALDTIGRAMIALTQPGNALHRFLISLGDTLDTVLNGFRRFVINMVGNVQGLINGIADIVNPISRRFHGPQIPTRTVAAAQGAVAALLPSADIGQNIRAVLGPKGWFQTQGQAVVDQGKSARQTALDILAWGRRQRQDNFFYQAQKWTEDQGNAAADHAFWGLLGTVRQLHRAQGRLSAADRAITNYDRSLGTEADRKQRWDELVKNTNEIARYSKESAEASNRLHDDFPAFLERLSARTAANIAEDAALSILRSG